MISPPSLECRPLTAPLPVPVALQRLRQVGPVVALESGRPGAEPGLKSFVASHPRVTMALSAGRWQVAGGAADQRRVRAAVARAQTPFHALEQAVQALSLPEMAPGGPPVGAFGFFGYGCRKASGKPTGDAWPDAWFLLTDTVVEYADADQPPRVWGPDVAPVCQLLTEASAGARARRSGRRVPLLRPPMNRERHHEAFLQVKEHLRKGDSYQLCYTYAIERPFHGDPLDLFEALRRRNPAPYAAYLEAGDLAIASSSPERFLRLHHDGRAEACPMKGTAPRTGEPDRDRESRQALLHSAKDRAENLMIADLLRNDLGQVCQLGSARVSAPAVLEEHATVYQLVSRVEGHLEEGRSGADLLAAAFPPGSMTGCPKERAMEILEGLEEGPRGPYSGILGYLTATGQMDWSVLIRSWFLSPGRALCGVGGGIVWDSEADREWEETEWKARAMLEALALVEQGEAGR